MKNETIILAYFGLSDPMNAVTSPSKCSYLLDEGLLTIYSSRSARDLDGLFGVAQRINPKRPFLFVNKTLGRHVPVAPSVMRESYNALAARVPRDLPTPIVFLGMAETAVGLGAGVYRALKNQYPDSLYVTSTRTEIEATPLCTFSEDHSHATEHTIYTPIDPALCDRLSRAKTIVLIDDEATTGNTFLNALNALRPHTAVEHVVTVTLTDWSQTAVSDRCDLPVTSVSLLSGQWSWSGLPQTHHSVKAVTPPTVSATRASVPLSHWGRTGMDSIPTGFGHNVTTHPGERVLVLGTNEFVFEPFLLAERLESEGAKVLFSATTRSPIQVGDILSGDIIQSKVSFSDPYGNDVPNFVYNALNQLVDRVLICTELDRNNEGLQALQHTLQTHGLSTEIVRPHPTEATDDASLGFFEAVR